jgi:hypothetical protein
VGRAGVAGLGALRGPMVFPTLAVTVYSGLVQMVRELRI